MRRREIKGIGRKRKKVDVGSIEMIGRNEVCGVEIEMIDGEEELEKGKEDIIGGEIVMEVDEGIGIERIKISRKLEEDYEIEDEIKGKRILERDWIVKGIGWRKGKDLR